jgi:hypothetical protein
MATYRIDISSDAQTITAATYESCITAMTMDINTDPQQIVDSTGATNGNFTMHCTSNGSSQSREYTYRLVYTHNGGDCEHNIHLVQSGSSQSVLDKNIYLDVSAKSREIQGMGWNSFIVLFTDNLTGDVSGLYDAAGGQSHFTGTTDSTNLYAAQLRVYDGSPCTYYEDGLSEVMTIYHPNGSTWTEVPFEYNKSIYAVFFKEGSPATSATVTGTFKTLDKSSVTCNDYIMKVG